ncbi:MAG: RNA pseudouridine synthase [Puniceicoccales bacterium]|jgi:23S rRNA-/tRNA-specific pseudouridylate synthase|nr:RNA pseudouridine synthase [Puniceicoccales bacterium]
MLREEFDSIGELNLVIDLEVNLVDGHLLENVPAENEKLLRLIFHAGVEIVGGDGRGLVAVEKPAGVLSQPNGETADRRAIIFAPYDCATRAYVDGDGSPLVYLVNRLDSATGGLLLLSMDADTAARARKAFRSREVRKTYYATVFGGRNFRDGRWRDRICTARNGNYLRADGGEGPAAEALTDVSLLDRRRIDHIDLAILELHPITGRTHQLRHQCALRSMAIVGDRTYGDFKLNRLVAKKFALRDLQLHSAAIEISGWQTVCGSEFSARSPAVESFLDWSKFSKKPRA